MDAKTFSTPSPIELTAPPPPMRHRFQLPTEPLLFVAVIVVLTLGIAKAVPQFETASDNTAQPPVVVVHADHS